MGPKLGRINCSELHEQPWFPETLRDDVTDALQVVLSALNFYQPMAAELGRAMQAAGTNRVVDLCSGAGGPWIWLHRALARQSTEPVEICLSDKFPNITAFERIKEESGGAVSYCAEPVDAMRIPAQIGGFRTIFSSFHHFSPDQAVGLLRDAVENGQGFGMFEAARRRISCVLLTFLMPLAALAMVPMVRPFRLSVLFWTYLIPVVPFVLWFDGLLSCLRAYSPGELRELIARLPANEYTWEVGEKRGGLSPVTYLIGYPKQAGRA